MLKRKFATLEVFKKEIEVSARLQAEAAAELDALLDRAFKGEL